MEQWAQVRGFEGDYEVSDAGRLRRISARRKQTKSGDYIKSPSRQKRGYLQYVLCVNRVLTCKLAHRLVWEAFRDEIPDGLEINHINGLKDDNRLANLEIVSRSENIHHAIHVLKCNRRDQRGERNSSAKLLNTDVEEIRRRLADSIPQWKIAKDFSVSDATVSYIKSGKRRSS
jgi:hypothetical protein